MKKEIKILFVILTGIILGGYFGYKLFNLHNYNLKLLIEDNVEMLEGLDNQKEMHIKTTQLDENEYLEFKNIKIKNEFKNFIILDDQNPSDDYKKYVLYDDEGNVEASFWIAVTNDNFVTMLKSDITIFGVEGNELKEVNLKNFIKRNNIETDIDVIKYLKDNKSYNNTIFTSSKKMKENYAFYYINFIAIPKLQSYTQINGDYTGYMFDMAMNAKEVGILKDEKKYVFTFINKEYFNDDYINELLNTLVIE